MWFIYVLLFFSTWHPLLLPLFLSFFFIISFVKIPLHESWNLSSCSTCMYKHVYGYWIYYYLKFVLLLHAEMLLILCLFTLLLNLQLLLWYFWRPNNVLTLTLIYMYVFWTFEWYHFHYRSSENVISVQYVNTTPFLTQSLRRICG